MNETFAIETHSRRRTWMRIAGTLAAAYAAYFMCYGVAIDRYFQAHHLSVEFQIQFDGFGFDLCPDSGFEELPIEERYRTMDLYEYCAKYGISLPWVSDGPNNFFFSVGASLGFFALGLSLALLALIWFWWMGPRFGLRALLTLVLGLGFCATCLKLASHSAIEYARPLAAMPFLALGASMLVQRAARKSAPPDAARPES